MSRKDKEINDIVKQLDNNKNVVSLDIVYDKEKPDVRFLNNVCKNFIFKTGFNKKGEKVVTGTKRPR